MQEDAIAPRAIASANLDERISGLRSLNRWLKTIFLSTLGTRDGH